MNFSKLGVQQQQGQGHLHLQQAAVEQRLPNDQQLDVRQQDVRHQLPASLRWSLAAQLTSR